MINFPNLPQFLREAYFSRLLITYPGRRQLCPPECEQYGTTMANLSRYARPLIFEDGDGGEEYYGIAGTCFLARYRGKLFVITARHCLSPKNGNDIRIMLDEKPELVLPFKNLHVAEDETGKQDYSDIVFLEANLKTLLQGGLDDIDALALDELKCAQLDLKENAQLFVPGYPKALNGVDYDCHEIITQCYWAGGNYEPASNGKSGIYALRFGEFDANFWPDGMSGSPVYYIEEYPQSHYFGFLGMLIKAQREGRKGEFIGANIIFGYLDAIVDKMESGE